MATELTEKVNQALNQNLKQGLHFDKSINLSHILYALVIAISCLGWFMHLESVSAVNTAKIEELQVEIKENKAENTSRLQRIEDKIDRLVERKSK